MKVVISTVTWSPTSTILWNALRYVLKVHNEAEIREEWSDKINPGYLTTCSAIRSAGHVDITFGW